MGATIVEAVEGDDLSSFHRVRHALEAGPRRLDPRQGFEAAQVEVAGPSALLFQPLRVDHLRVGEEGSAAARASVLILGIA